MADCAQRTRSIVGLAELTLETAELERMERFYSQVLRLEVLSREHDRSARKLARQ